jgi:hypothetical protein
MIGQPLLDHLHVAEGSTHPDTAETHVIRTEIRPSASYRVPNFREATSEVAVALEKSLHLPCGMYLYPFLGCIDPEYFASLPTLKRGKHHTRRIAQIWAVLEFLSTSRWPSHGYQLWAFWGTSRSMAGCLVPPQRRTQTLQQALNSLRGHPD